MRHVACVCAAHVSHSKTGSTTESHLGSEAHARCSGRSTGRCCRQGRQPRLTSNAESNSGAPDARIKSYELNDEVQRRKDANPLHTSSVIVTLVPGAQLPRQFQKFARANGNLDIINSRVLDLPNGLMDKRPAS